MSCNDFDSLGGGFAAAFDHKAGMDGKKKKDQGEKRNYLKVYETLPSQCLNAYGPAKYAKMSDPDVWANFNLPLKSGGLWMTELCSIDAERRGIGLKTTVSTSPAV